MKSIWRLRFRVQYQFWSFRVYHLPTHVHGLLLLLSIAISKYSVKIQLSLKTYNTRPVLLRNAFEWFISTVLYEYLYVWMVLNGYIPSTMWLSVVISCAFHAKDSSPNSRYTDMMDATKPFILRTLVNWRQVRQEGRVTVLRWVFRIENK